MLGLLLHVRNIAALLAASVWRALQTRTTVIAITGSSGKTTSRKCLVAILAQRGPVLTNPGNANASFSLSRLVLRMRRRHRHAVIEVGVMKPGQMIRWARVVSPDVAVMHVLNPTYGEDLKTLDVVAREKARMFDALRRGGVAVLNGEDSRIRAMQAPRAGRRLLFGDCDGSVARASDVRASPTDGLRFVLHTPEGSRDIHVELFGAHWVPAVLGACTAAGAVGCSLEEIATGLAAVRPHPGRMQPVTLPSGAILIRDEVNSSPASFLAAVAFMRTVEARRRVLILSEVRNVDENPIRRFQWLADRTRSVFDGALFIGEHADVAARVFRESGLGDVHALAHTRDAAGWVSRSLQAGDVALLRGRGQMDHLTRVVLAQFGPISCWKDICELKGLCDDCSELRAPERPARAR